MTAQGIQPKDKVEFLGFIGNFVLNNRQGRLLTTLKSPTSPTAPVSSSSFMSFSPQSPTTLKKKRISFRIFK